jgi:hypothetical protein
MRTKRFAFCLSIISLLLTAANRMRGKAASVLTILLLLGSTGMAREFDHAKICEAIQNGWQVRIFYRSGESERMVLPRFLGYTGARNVILNGLQISGFSESGNLPGHRSFRLDRMTDIQFTTSVTPSPQGSGRLPSGIVELICSRDVIIR